MSLLPDSLEDYLAEHYSQEPPILMAINQQTYLEQSAPHMLSGKVQGRFLSMISRLMQPQSILELGTFTGYSAICLAEGLANGGKLTTIEKNTAHAELSRANFSKAGLSDKIDLLLGDIAIELPKLSGPFDLVFMDADKKNMALYYSLILPNLLRAGGLLIVDNVLWKGKVMLSKPDNATVIMQSFNDLVQADGRVENVLLPLRDGLMLVRKCNVSESSAVKP